MPPVPLFPPAPTTSFVKADFLQAALDHAVKAACARKDVSSDVFPVPISIVDVGSGGTGASSLRYAGFHDDEEDYIASEVKIGVLYAAYVFRDMVRRFNLVVAPKDPADLFK